MASRRPNSVRFARQQLKRYENVHLLERRGHRCHARNRSTLFESRLTTVAPSLRASVDRDRCQWISCPRLPRIEEFWGNSVHQCPYCDGWELRGAPVAVYGKRARGFEMARALTAWTSDIALCTDGRCRIQAMRWTQLQRNGIEVIEESIIELRGKTASWKRWYSTVDAGCRRRALFSIRHASPIADRHEAGLPDHRKGGRSMRSVRSDQRSGRFCRRQHDQGRSVSRSSRPPKARVRHSGSIDR